MQRPLFLKNKEEREAARLRKLKHKADRLEGRARIAAHQQIHLQRINDANMVIGKAQGQGIGKRIDDFFKAGEQIADRLKPKEKGKKGQGFGVF